MHYFSEPESARGAQYCEAFCGEICGREEMGFECVRVAPPVRFANRLAWEVFTTAWGETQGMGESPVDLLLCIELLKAWGEKGPGILDGITRIKIIAGQYREIKRAQREREKALQELEQNSRSL